MIIYIYAYVCILSLAICILIIIMMIIIIRIIILIVVKIRSSNNNNIYILYVRPPAFLAVNKVKGIYIQTHKHWGSTRMQKSFIWSYSMLFQVRWNGRFGVASKHVAIVISHLVYMSAPRISPFTSTTHWVAVFKYSCLIISNTHF